MKPNTAYCFDLDGTVTRREVLPIIAAELGLAEEIGFLTEMTIRGQIPFEMSFRLRCRLLAEIEVDTVARIVEQVPLEEPIARFIRQHPDNSYIITGNLDVWISRLASSLGCGIFSSKAEIRPNGRLGALTHILRKSQPIHELSTRYDRVVCIGEGFNDMPMFEEADIGIAYGGVHPPARELISNSTYIISEGEALCRLLNTL
ncbi:MAG TPA: HAD family phosphatase [Opitutales bacterium]|nr:HAD family phosphatase [Opitutales bacterium]